MKVLDPGHVYVLDCLGPASDSPSAAVGGQLLQFVKHVGDKYPGNEPPAHDGVTSQEVIRALLDRTKYVQGQDFSLYNVNVIVHLREALWQLEARAATERGDARKLF